MAISGRDLIRWSTLYERRSSTALTRPLFIVAALGAAFASWVAWRTHLSFEAGSQAWLAGACVAFAIAFLRVPFHLYWRADAALLAQLPIEGEALLAAALYRCVRAAIATTAVVTIGAAPLFEQSTDLALRHLALAATLGASAALLLPAVALFAARLVAISASEAVASLRAVTGVDAAARPPSPNTALLGALPGFASTGVFVAILLLPAWLVGRTPSASAAITLAILVGASVLAIAGTRAGTARVMGTILRDVSSLDRQRLATLDIRPPTGLERVIGAMTGDGALAYSKDARLMRRRYPMAYALGALAFLVLVIIGFKQPVDPMPWLVATLAGMTAYGLAVGGRLHRPPIELIRLSHSLPITNRARLRAKLAWVVGWWFVFVLAPGLFAALRQASPIEGLSLVGGATIVVIGAALFRR
ncbi:MAG: hypothetical protein ACKV2T_37625 [Kofleriaceae bacterium]